MSAVAFVTPCWDPLSITHSPIRVPKVFNLQVHKTTRQHHTEGKLPGSKPEILIVEPRDGHFNNSVVVLLQVVLGSHTETRCSGGFQAGGLVLFVGECPQLLLGACHRE